MAYKTWLDAGHGGTDPGALDGLGLNDFINSKESVIALSVAYYARAALMRNGVIVEMTRYDETFVSLSDRCSRANAWGANRFVSIHFNSATTSDARGIEVLTYAAGTTGDKMAQTVFDKVDGLTPWVDRGVKYRPDLAVLNGTNMPAILVEGGFLTNTEEETLVNTADYQFRLGEAIAAGVCANLGIPYVAPSPMRPQDYEAKIVTLTNQIYTLKADATKLDATIKTQNDKIVQLNATVATMSSALETAKASNLQLSSVNATLTTEKEALTTDLNKARADNAYLTTELEKHEQFADSVAKALASL
jgi:N-acetylmuramoyl-L-alanine amidase